mmetsp:Transcript_18417/g.19171  ORF Transcript_18417/g.19171 Transcript_18417/m.19171 type:complete len:107 (-) Transcript_18417:1-321(-)
MLFKTSFGFLIGVGIVLALFFIGIGYYIYIKRRNSVHHYDMVQHELDDEEIEFKRMIEMQGDDLEEMFDMKEEDVTFDLKDRSRLEMLEQYRSQLVSEVSTNQNNS